MAELHFIGEILDGVNFDGRSFFVEFELQQGPQWTPVEGYVRGTTHVAYRNPHSENVSWSFPLDIHYAFQSMQGWPKIAIQVWSLDEFGRKDIAGYGTAFLPLPTSTSDTVLEIPTWKPSFWHPSLWMRMYQQSRLMFMGGNPVLRDESVVGSNDQRFKLYTIAGGTVRLRMSAIARRTAAIGLRFD